jgi:hypothetical protein
LLDEEASWPAKHIDGDRGRVIALREELVRKHVCDWFTSPQELAAKVNRHGFDAASL